MVTCDATSANLNSCDNRKVANPSASLENTAKLNNKTSKYPQSSQECADVCKKTNGCKAWSYKKDSCQLADEAKFNEVSGYQSGPAELRLVKPDCTKTSADYRCKSSIDATENIGSPLVKLSWTECRSMCDGDTACKGFMWSDEDGMCQKKKSIGYRTGKAITGPRSSGTSTGTSTSTTTSPPSTTTTTTTAPLVTTAPSSEWLYQKSPLGLPWWGVVVALVIILFAFCGCMMMMVSMRGGGD